MVLYSFQSKNTPEISVISSCSAGVLLADIYGNLHILNKDFESVRSWVAHVGGRVTHMVDRKGVLVTIGVSLFLNAVIPVVLINISGRRECSFAITEDMGSREDGQEDWDAPPLAKICEDTTWRSTSPGKCEINKYYYLSNSSIGVNSSPLCLPLPSRHRPRRRHRSPLPAPRPVSHLLLRAIRTPQGAHHPRSADGADHRARLL